MQIRVYRDVIDDIPARLETQIQIGVSGQAREEVLGPVLPEGFMPLSIGSEWPARLDDDGKLHVQVQPGENTITLRARATAPLTHVTARLPAAPWPKQETWSYAADPALRVTTASSALQVDPRQAGVPERMEHATRVRARRRRRAHHRTTLARTRAPTKATGSRCNAKRGCRSTATAGSRAITSAARWCKAGVWTSPRRICSNAPTRRIRHRSEGAERLLITQGTKSGLSGVEWRTPTVDLAAGVRVASGASTLPVTGWQDTFDRIDTTLHLPYGYRLLGAPGADSASGSWMSRWTSARRVRLRDARAARVALSRRARRRGGRGVPAARLSGNRLAVLELAVRGRSRPDRAAVAGRPFARVGRRHSPRGAARADSRRAAVLRRPVALCAVSAARKQRRPIGFDFGELRRATSDDASRQ